jgi:hypothetical protein
MPRGGYRPGAGRKKKEAVEATRVRALARQAIPDATWLALFKELARRATYDTATAALLLRFALSDSAPVDPEPPVVDVADADPASPQPAAASGRAPDS